MKDLKVVLLGFVSCTLLAAGFARASERFDPLTAQSPTKADQGTVEQTPENIPCFENGGSYDGPGTSWSGDDDGQIQIDPQTPLAPR